MISSTVSPETERQQTPTSWQHSLRDAVRSTSELLSILEVQPTDIDWFQPGEDEFPLLVPRSFVARMRPGDPNDPLLRQVLPTAAERRTQPGFVDDPLDELAVAQDGVLQKYAGRALVITTAACPVHCRYCFRRHFPYELQTASRRNWESALSELRRRGDVREVILSGGDPLTLSNRRLRELVSELERFPSLTTLRIHSRFPIILPERLDREFIEILQDSRLAVVLVVHSNHANEIDEAVSNAIGRVRTAGCLVLNQSVLLRGINNEVKVLEELSSALFAAGVLPYYLHQLDRVAGTAHFEVPNETALRLVAELRQRLPGYLVPQLVQEIPGELSKTPLRESHL